MANTTRDMHGVKGILLGVFYLIFGLLFGALVLRLAVRWNAPPLALLLLTGILVALALFFQLLSSKVSWLEKQYPILLTVFLGVFAVFQFGTIDTLRFTPGWDLGAVYGGAIEWAETGDFPNYHDYYYLFPNNLGAMALLAFVFKAMRGMGATDYFLIASILNGTFVLFGMFLTVTICKKQLGVRGAIFAMVLFYLCPPFYFMAAVFYTDSLSLLFPVLVYYLYLRLKDAKTIWGRIVLMVLLGVATTIGTIIKATVLIMLIAVVIDSLFTRSLKNSAIMAAVSIAILCLGFWGLQSIIYPAHLDRERADEWNTPSLHWIMMGLQGDGGYNPDDYEFTRSFLSRTEREEGLKEEIGRRLDELGPDGLYQLFWAKATKDFSDGTLGQYEFLDDGPVHHTKLHDFLLYEGEGHDAYHKCCQLTFLCALALTAISGLEQIVRKRSADSGEGHASWQYIAPRVALFGVLLFLVSWETRERYITNYVPIIFILATLGIPGCLDAMKRIRENISLRVGRNANATD